MKILLACTILSLVFSCKSKIDYYREPLKSENGYYQAVIEIPAGSNAKIEYDKVDRTFKTSVRNGQERLISFLAYPANYGFLPSTLSDPENGGDGDPLDIMVISSRIDSGEIIEVIPIAVLYLIDNNEEDFKIIAIPAEENKRNIDVENFAEFSEKYSAAKEIIETWFSNYDPNDPTKIDGWGDEKQAIEEIEKTSAKL